MQTLLLLLWMQLTLYIYCVIVRNTQSIKYRYIDFILQFYLFFFMKDLRFNLRLDLNDLGFEENGLLRFEIWPNDLNTFLEKFEFRV